MHEFLSIAVNIMFLNPILSFDLFSVLFQKPENTCFPTDFAIFPSGKHSFSHVVVMELEYMTSFVYEGHALYGSVNRIW